jgi:multidrug efflux pump
VFAAVISLLLVILGLVSLQRLTIREYPDIDRPVISVTTRYTGASAPIIETKITQPIEDSVAGIEGILKIESDSEDERSQIRIEFDVNRDVDAAANDVRDRVARVVAALPDEADPPEILKADATGEPVVSVAFFSSSMSLLELTDYAERSLVDQLSTVPGVARVGISGGRRYSMRIWIDRQALAARQLTVTDVEDALRRENVELPAGRLESVAREFSVRTLVGLSTPQDFASLVIARGQDGHLVQLGEVAEVAVAAENERSYTRANGQPGVILTVEAQSKGNTLDIARRVRALVERLRPTLPPGSSIGMSIDNAVSIEAALHEVLVAVGFALLSVLAVIYVFLGNLRATLVPAITIPVSIIASLTVMYALGYSINVLTLLGLVLAIGLVVDDAIVVLENVHRRAELGAPPFVAAIMGSKEIGFAVIATTLTLASVFVPISFLPGDLGRLFREFGFTLAASVLLSALIALTLTPMLASRLPQSTHGAFSAAVNRGFRAVAKSYERWLRAVIARPWTVIAGVFALIGIGVATFRSVPNEFTPTVDTGRAYVTIEGPEGTSFDRMDLHAARLEGIVMREMESGDIERVVLRVPGTNTSDGRSGDVNNARAIVLMKPWEQRERSSQEIANAIVAEAAKMPGIRASTSQPQSFGRRGGSSKPVEAVIGGPDYERLAEWSDQLVRLAQANPGLTGVETSYKERKPQIRVAIDRKRAADLGISLETIGRTLETMLGSRVVTTYVDRGREYNVILQSRDDMRATTSDLTNIRVRSTRTDALIPLSSIVTLEETSGALRLSRFNRLRSVEVQASLAPGYTMGEAVQWFEDTVAAELPAEATLTWDGESGEFTRSGQQLYVTFLLALAIVYLVLAAQFESFVHPLIIMVTVPLALLGAVFGLKLFGLTVNIFSQIAVVMLIGIAAKNGVLIVEFANQLRDRGVEFYEAIVEASVIRLRPVLMTSFCTAFGALPLMLAAGAGAEQRKPIGIVVFLGVLVAVFLTLLVVPTVYAVLARRTKSPQYVSRLVDALMAGFGASEAPGGSLPSGTARAVSAPLQSPRRED